MRLIIWQHKKKTLQIKFSVLLAPLNPAVFENKNAWIKCLISWDWQIGMGTETRYLIGLGAKL